MKTKARLSIDNAVLDQHVYINMANQDIQYLLAYRTLSRMEFPTLINWTS